jgi:hypothetical protein
MKVEIATYESKKFYFFRINGDNYIEDFLSEHIIKKFATELKDELDEYKSYLINNGCSIDEEDGDFYFEDECRTIGIEYLIMLLVR